MATETFKKYGDATLYHDGPRNAEYPALVLGARYDSGVTLGPNGEPTLTLAYLNPATPQNGPLRGDLLDAVLVAHDVPYLAFENLTAVGYSDAQFDYPVATTPTLEERLADALKQIEALQAEAAATNASAPAPVEPVVEPAAPVIPAEGAETKTEPSEPAKAE